MKSGTQIYLPEGAKRALKALGARIRLARKARKWTQANLAEKMSVSVPTVISLEKGNESVSIGVLFSALWTLSLEREISALSQFEDQVGEELLSRSVPSRVRVGRKKRMNNDF